MIRIHDLKNGIKVAEIEPDSAGINDAEEMLDIMADAGYNGCSGIILYESLLPKEFFDLKTKLAGEILQKFSNYRMRLAIIGDFSNIKSRSLRDFIRESNKRGIITFPGSLEEALSVLNKSN